MQPKKGVVRPNAATWRWSDTTKMLASKLQPRSCPTLRMYGVWSSYVCTEFQPQIHVYGLRQYRVRLVLEFREMVEPLPDFENTGTKLHGNAHDNAFADSLYLVLTTTV